MSRLFLSPILFLFILISCKQQSNESDVSDIKQSVDHWEITKTFKNYNHSSLLIDTVENEYKIIKGNNQVFILTTSSQPIFKKGMYLTDLSSAKSLLIELDKTDNFVTINKLGNSKLFRQINSFSPNHGIKLLKNNENIAFTRKGINIWKVESKIKDFVFSGELNFFTNQTLTEKFDDY
jgi:hypothetical protein